MSITVETPTGFLTSTEGEWTSPVKGLAEVAREFLSILSNQVGPSDPWANKTEAENVAKYLSGEVVSNTDIPPESLENIVY